MTRKKLVLETLRVDSFPTTPASPLAGGTVFGHETIANSCRPGCATLNPCVDPTRVDCIYPTPSCEQNGTYTADACYSLVPHTDPRACCTDATCGPGGSV